MNRKEMDVFEQRLVLPDESSMITRLRQEIGQSVLSQVTPEPSSDIGLLRFLRGYAHDVPAAAAAFKSGMEWRLNNDVARWRALLIMRKDPEECTFGQIVSHYTDMTRLPHWLKVGVAYPERFFHGHDKYGNPIMLTSHDMIENVFALMTIVTPQEYDEFRAARAVNLELYLDALTRHLKRLVKCVYIWDLNGMTRALWKTWENKSVKAFWRDWDHQSAIAFPEQAHRIVAVNLASWLMLVWKMVKSLIPGRTLRKVYVLGTSGVAEALLKQCEIPPKALPKHLGGTCTVSYCVRPREIEEFRMGTVEIPAGTTRAIEVQCSSGMLYWSVFVHGGKEAVVKQDAVMQTDGKSVVGPQTIRVDEFHRGIFDVSDRLSGSMFRLQIDNLSSMFFSKTIDFVVAPFPEVFHDVKSSISQE